MRVFKTTWFDRFAGKEGIADDELRRLVNQLEAGQVEAELGGGVFKMRVARPGEGKSSGYRIIVFFRHKERTFYVYGFAKSDRANISQKELKNLKKQAVSLFSMSNDKIETALREGVLREIKEGDHE